jgi:TetR/AcrR family transcriptional regulator, tetracycline repressor protein
MLTRRFLIEQALILLDREGLERFSMRRLAEQLGVTPMALYNHASSKQDLLQGVADAVIEQVQYPPEQDDWREAIRGCFRALRHTCLAHPGAVPLVESAKVLPAATFRPMEVTLSALQRAGFSPEDAMRAYSLLTTFTLGQASYQIRGWSRGVDAAAAVREGRIAATTFPAVVQAISHSDWDFEASFEFGLSIILVGLSVSGGTP